jgi:hypothetical protein
VATLTITFGGLCLFVRRYVDPAGLYVFMPRTHRVHGEMHCPLLISDHPTSASNWLVTPYEGRDETLGTFGAPAPDPFAKLPPQMLRMSRYAALPVASSLYGMAPPTGCLLAKVRMPIDTEILRIGDVGQMAPPDDDPGPFTGEVTVELQVAGRLKIGGQEIHPNGNNFQVQLVNVPISHLKKPFRPVRQAEEAHHTNAYYSLLRDQSCPSTLRRPIKFGETTTHSGPFPDPEPCRLQAFSMPRVGIRWIDPLNCTIGMACDENDPLYPYC